MAFDDVKIHIDMHAPGISNDKINLEKTCKDLTALMRRYLCFYSCKVKVRVLEMLSYVERKLFLAQ